MISHRLRAVAAGIPIAVLTTVLMASPGFAAESLRIDTPLAGTAVGGDLAIEGTIVGATEVDLVLGLAPQSLGDCGSPVIEERLELAESRFSATLSTTAVPDGAYCLTAIADGGRLSTVVGDITVNNAVTNGESTDGFQLPTEALGGDDRPGTLPAVLAATPLEASLGLLGPAVLATTAVVALVVLGFGLWARRRLVS
ncbi:hypothetical protein [Microcella humidisoli]|uniref:Sortase n=1 Tax=Microcella humidisoli TaxID=2963406 RepID=A0ABY5FYT6_9MICO|nr:hypothetical protein [Microcella humidisoli]UTT63296.1 hypothetical protein NNL39_04110 [Microcella humidisoli]